MLFQTTHSNNGIAMKKSFILHIDSLVILDEMTNEQAGKFLKSIYLYRKTGKLPQLDFAMKMAIAPFTNQFIRDEENYQKTCQKNKKIADERWSTKSTTGKNGTKKVPKSTKSTYSDSDNKNDNKKDNKKEIKKRFCKPSLQELTDYCNSRNNGINPQSFLDKYDSNGWVTGKNKTPMKDWKATIRIWENYNKAESKPKQGYKYQDGVPL